MSDGEISGNTASSYGGGVYVGYYGTFTMEGGKISGNTAHNQGGGVYVDHGTFIKNGGGTIDDTNTANAGKVAYAGEAKQRNTTAGPSVNLDSRINGLAGGWEREP
jgi:hypothetical protein